MDLKLCSMTGGWIVLCFQREYLQGELQEIAKFYVNKTVEQLALSEFASQYV